MAEAAPDQSIQARYAHTLQQLGAAQLPPEELLKCYPSSGSSSPVDLTKCEFYADFAASPAEVNAQREVARKEAEKKHGAAHVQEILRSLRHHEWRKERRFDFRLQEHETQRLVQHGLVVSQRMSAESFAEVYYRLYTDDMPVYVTTDSILHAWHRSFDAALVDIETQECIPVLEKILKQTSTKCHELCNSKVTSSTSGRTTRATEVLLDVDVFLTVAVSLLWGEESFGLPANGARVSALWKSVKAQTMMHATLFGVEREIDFSLFKPRGHYTKSQELERYFRAVTWLGTIDFRIAGTENDPKDDLYQLQCAVVLVGLLRETHHMSRLLYLDELISSLVGDGNIGADSLTPMQLDKLLPASLSAGDLLQTYVGDGGIDGLFPPALLELQVEIVAKGLGVQLISGHPHVESASSLATSTPTALPTSFAFFGQRFVWSAFIFSRLVYDQIIDQKTKVVRRMPSAVDVAFSLLGNDAAGAIAAQRMSSSDSYQTKRESRGFVPLRDGIPYASNLVALRETIDSEFGEAVDAPESISTLWVRALRELSKPSANQASVFQSNAWQLRQLNAQLASFTQLRHDTVLYAKQSYTMGTRCEYASGFVDPYPQFYAKMGQMATRMAETIQNLRSPTEDFGLKYKGVVHFKAFGETMKTLEEIAVCQANKQPLSDEQTSFIKTVMEERFGSGSTKYAGWYPKLFYTERVDSGKRDVLVVDVHTDVPSVEHNDPGGVLHLGVGDVHFGFFVVDNVVYSGPVFSSYEFVTSINERLTDDEFKAQLDSKTTSTTLSPPDWALASFLG